MIEFGNRIRRIFSEVALVSKILILDFHLKEENLFEIDVFTERRS